MSVYSVSLINNLKHHTWNVGLPPFQETWILKAFFTFHTLKIKPSMTDQPFVELSSFHNNGIDVRVPRWWSQSLQVWGPAGWSAHRTNREKSQWCWNISTALGNPEYTDQKMFATCQASKDRTTHTQFHNSRIVAYLLCWTFPPCFSSASKSWCHSWMPGNQKGAKKN